MGRHAFEESPQQARHLVETHPEIRCEGVVGLAERWDLPLALWRAEAGFDARHSANPHGTLSFIVSGSAIERLDGRFRGRAGGRERDSFILYPGDLDRRYAASSDVRVCHIYIRPSLLRAVAEEASLPGASRASLRDDRIFASDRELRIMADQYLRRSLDPQAPPSLLEMDGRTLLIALRLLECHSDLGRGRAAAVGGLCPERLRRVIDHVEAHLGEPVTLADLAAVAGLSRFHFATAFRRATGHPPHRFITLRRIARAKALIRAGDSLASLALDCGFSSQQHLTNAFRRETGSPPTAWRRSAPS
jgi:AraC family transcriptional regulator